MREKRLGYYYVYVGLVCEPLVATDVTNLISALDAHEEEIVGIWSLLYENYNNQSSHLLINAKCAFIAMCTLPISSPCASSALIRYASEDHRTQGYPIWVYQFFWSYCYVLTWILYRWCSDDVLEWYAYHFHIQKCHFRRFVCQWTRSQVRQKQNGRVVCQDLWFQSWLHHSVTVR